MDRVAVGRIRRQLAVDRAAVGWIAQGMLSSKTETRNPAGAPDADASQLHRGELVPREIGRQLDG